MKSHVMLLGRVLEDSSIRCCTSTTQDLKTVLSRVEDEGISFLTITLPRFGKDFERCLDLGEIDPSLFQGFRKSGFLPAFLQGLTGQVFNRVNGTLLDDPSVDAIYCIRQVCHLFGKVELPCSDARIYAAFDNFVECEQAVQAADKERSGKLISEFLDVCSVLYAPLLSTIDEKVVNGEVVPKHGPGATADKLRGNAKFDNRLWTTRLEEWFPAGEFLYTNWRHYFNAIEDGNGPVWLEPGDEIPVRVITVPKTMKTPRIIAIEPTHMQYVQQGLMEMIVGGIEQVDSPLAPFIGFEDQSINRDLACKGSRDGSLATLDLSEASDRVSFQLVKLMLGTSAPNLLGAVDSCRSRRADVPGHGVIPLSKFASMGSALTFPIEAMVFTAIVFIGICRELSVPFSNKLLQEFRGQVRVYGDDIIVPVRFVHSVVGALEDFGLLVNRDKSFWTGKFRESCGGDYYDGTDVKPVRVRHSLPAQRKHVQEIISTVSLRNQFYFAGMWRTAEYLDALLERFIPMPKVHPGSPGLGRQTYLDYEIQRVCPVLQRPLVKAAVVTSLSPHSDVSWEGALLKYFLKRGELPFADGRHLERAGRPEVVDIKPRWVTPY